jgi:hypothetical protein
MISFARTALAAAFSLGIVATASANPINNFPSFVGEFQEGYGIGQSSGIAGQTFQTPNATEVILQSFSLSIGPAPSASLPSSPVTAVGQIYQWGGDTPPNIYGAPMGAPLWTSDSMPVDLGLLADGELQTFLFSPNIELDSSLTYVALLNVLGNSGDGTDGELGFAFVGEGGIGGALVFGFIPPPDPDSTSPNDLGFNWFYGDPADALFTATFVAPRDPVGIPVPASIALFGVGLAGLTLVRRRKAA